MFRRRSRGRTAAALVALVSTGLVTVPGSVTADDLADTVSASLDLVPVAAPVSVGAFRAEGAPRIAVVSSGIEPAVLPEALRPQVALIGNGGDPIGLGTFVASQLLQLAPAAKLTAINVYPGGRFNADSLVWAMNHLGANTSSFDAVLYAVSPRDFLDPVSSAMARGIWPALDQAISTFGLPGKQGPVYGVPLWGNLRAAQTKGIDSTSAWLLNDFAAAVSRWSAVEAGIDKLAAAGVTVVSPAGDEGSGLQRVLGVPNFPKVLAVAAGDHDGIVPVSASGPSITGGIKPDLAAPTGVVGLVPEGSSMARALRAADKLDADLVPDWAAGAPYTTARARLASTFSAASVVTAAVAGMAAGGVRDVARQKAALAAAAVPALDVPVWRQGAGILRFGPDASLAETTPLVLGTADLGAEPESGPWTTSMKVVNGDASGPPSVDLGDFVGVGPDARNYTDSRQAPPVGVSVDNGAVTITATAGPSSYEGGLYCGYTEVPVVGTGGSVDPRLSAHGIPEGTEQAPTCLVNGSSFDAFAFYLHQLPAEDQTFALLPALPPGANLLEHPLSILPVNPLHTTLFSRVTGVDGHARFHNVPPGYYKVKLFSDYGAPMQSTVTDAVTGAPKRVDEDFGEAMGYQALDMLVLSGECPEVCTAENFDRTTNTHVIDLAGGLKLRIAPGRMKKAVGVGISSRVVDLLKYGDFTNLSADVASVTHLPALEGLGEVGTAWRFTPGVTNPEDTDATFDPTYLLANSANQNLIVGVQRYDFNLPTPNYSAVMNLNFRYQLDSAGVTVVVQIGKSFAVAVLSPNGTLTLPTIGADHPIDPTQLRVQPGTSGAANFTFRFFPRGERVGSMYFLYTPWIDANRGAVSPFSHVHVGDLSFELGTWTNADWPPTTTSHGAGHSYDIDPNYSARQMGHQLCRLTRSNTKTVGGVMANVCEDWQMVVHSPLDHAATVDLLDGSTGASLLAEMKAAGAVYANPHRGVHDATFALAWAQSTVAGAEAALSLAGGIRTNGRFWEQLGLPKAVIAAHPGPVHVEVLDLEPGRQSTLFPHVNGGQPVPPYVNFTPGR